jgi:hypothetical protein
MNLSNFKRLRIFDAIKDKFIIREDLKYTLTQALLLSARMKTATSRQDWEHVSYLCSFGNWEENWDDPSCSCWFTNKYCCDKYHIDAKIDNN